jgi:hypothetical protein
MKKTYADIRYTEITRYEDGLTGNEVGLMETLILEWDDAYGMIRASNPNGHPLWYGYGEGHTEAVLEYLKARLGLVERSPQSL